MPSLRTSCNQQGQTLDLEGASGFQGRIAPCFELHTRAEVKSWQPVFQPATPPNPHFLCCFDNNSERNAHLLGLRSRAETAFSDSIKSLAVGDDALAFVLQKEGNAKKQTLNLYNLSGREKMQQDISYEYADMEMYGDEIIFTGNRSCNILRTNGHDKFDYHFEQEIDAVYPTSDGQVYTLIDSSTIQKIRLQTK